MTGVLGHWKLEKNDDKWDAYMSAIGVGFILRKVGRTITSYEEIKQDGDSWELNITSTFKNVHLKFKLGEPFDETTVDGRNVKSTFTDEDGKLVHFQKNLKAGGADCKVTREKQDDDTMIITMVAVDKDVSTVRIFKRHTP